MGFVKVSAHPCSEKAFTAGNLWDSGILSPTIYMTWGSGCSRLGIHAFGILRAGCNAFGVPAPLLRTETFVCTGQALGGAKKRMNCIAAAKAKFLKRKAAGSDKTPPKPWEFSVFQKTQMRCLQLGLLRQLLQVIPFTTDYD